MPDIKNWHAWTDSAMDDFKTQLTKCNEVLKAGGIIIYPTTTLWALGCDARNQQTFQKLNHFHLKDERFPTQLEIGNHSKEMFAALSGLLPSI